MNYLPIEDYMKKDLSLRTQHLDLSEPCLEIGGNSTMFRGLLSYYLKTTIPSGFQINLCHKCNNDKCANPKHLYYGTSKENFKDYMESDRYKTLWEKRIEKHGIKKARELQGKGNKSAGGKGNLNKPKSEEHRRKISEALKKNK